MKTAGNSQPTHDDNRRLALLSRLPLLKPITPSVLSVSSVAKLKTPCFLCVSVPPRGYHLLFSLSKRPPSHYIQT